MLKKKHTDVFMEGPYVAGEICEPLFFFKRKQKVRMFTAVRKLYRQSHGYDCTWGRPGRPPCHKT